MPQYYYFFFTIIDYSEEKNKSFKEENQSTKEVWLRCVSDHEWHDITRYNLIMPQKWMINYITLSSCRITLSGFPQNNSFCSFVLAPSLGESNSFSISRTSLVIRRFNLNNKYSCHWPLILMIVFSQRNNITNCKVLNPVFRCLPYL